MAATTAALPAQQAAAAAAAARRHDPIKSVEGMFNGVLIRLAHALRDPKLAEATKIIVNECTKKYQDALDDCEIQILDAKWYLEAKLAENKAAREAEVKTKTANTEAAAVKRKLEDSDNHQQQDPGSPAKRARSNEPPSPKPAAAVENVSGAPDAMEGVVQDQAQPKEPEKSTVAKKEEPTTQERSEPKVEEKQEPPTTSDDFMNTPARETPDFDNFESMFGDPNEMDEGNTNNDDMNVDFNIDDFIGADSNTSTTPAAAPNPVTTQQQSQPDTQQPSQTQSQPQTQTQPVPDSQAPHNTSQTSLNNLLPGLEQFAKQRDDTNPLNPSFNMTSNTLDDSQNDANNNIFTADFEPNIFDSMFNEENFNANAEFGNVEDVDKIQSPRDVDINFDDFFS